MKQCQGELLQRVRRGLASTQEQTALEAHLGSCESCRMTFELMSDFDAVGEAEPGDSQRVATMANAAVAAHGKKAPVARWTNRRIWRLALAALVLTGAAGAGMAVRLTQDDPEPSEASPSTDGGKTGPASRAPAAPKKASPQGDVEAAAEAKETANSEDAQDDGEGSDSKLADETFPANGSVLVTVKEAYRAANDARRAGRSNEAIRRYRRLQKTFSGSPEAHASRVSLGGLLLRGGSASAALAQFDAYLASGGGQLSAEALYGRARALRALGRSEEEAQNLNRLVTNYPQSAYASHAQRRLLELD